MRRQPYLYSCYRVTIGFISLLVFLLSGKLSLQAQTPVPDSVVYDTTAMPATDLGEGAEQVETTGKKEDPFFYNRFDTLTVVERKIPDEEISRLKKEKDYWYADAEVQRDRSGKLVIPEKGRGKKSVKQEKEQGITESSTGEPWVPLGQRKWFQVFLWIVMLGVFIVGLIFYLGSSNVGLFRRKSIRVSGDTEETEATEDIFAIRYSREIEKAVAAGNYRLAVRLHFLQLLKQLSEKNIIRYQQDKTNFDYLSELHPTGYYSHFFRLTRHYEYSWYGQFPVSPENYAAIRRDFQHMDKQIAPN